MGLGVETELELKCAAHPPASPPESKCRKSAKGCSGGPRLVRIRVLGLGC